MFSAAKVVPRRTFDFRFHLAWGYSSVDGQDVRVDAVLAAVLASGGSLTQLEAAEQFGGSLRTFRRALKGQTGLIIGQLDFG